MTLPVSGRISMNMFAGEFMVPANSPMSSYYGKPGLPASGIMKFSYFYGKSNTITVGLTNSSSTVFGGTASMTLQPNGQVLGVSPMTSWFSPLQAGRGSAMDARLTRNSGVGTINNDGVWLNMGANRTWSVDAPAGLVRTANCTLDIRPAGGGSVIASCSITLTANNQ